MLYISLNVTRSSRIYPETCYICIGGGAGMSQMKINIRRTHITFIFYFLGNEREVAKLLWVQLPVLRGNEPKKAVSK
jgi:hypothetical protein